MFINLNVSFKTFHEILDFDFKESKSTIKIEISLFLKIYLFSL